MRGRPQTLRIGLHHVPTRWLYQPSAGHRYRIREAKNRMLRGRYSPTHGFSGESYTMASASDARQAPPSIGGRVQSMASRCMKQRHRCQAPHRILWADKSAARACVLKSSFSKRYPCRYTQVSRHPLDCVNSSLRRTLLIQFWTVRQWTDEEALLQTHYMICFRETNLPALVSSSTAKSNSFSVNIRAWLWWNSTRASKLRW